MDFDDELFEDSAEIGSDELLADENLRLPESANILVRIHALRAWLVRRQQETVIEAGEVALTLQYLQQEDTQHGRIRRSERIAHQEHVQQVQDELQTVQQRLAAYEEAQAVLEDCINHTTSGERVLVEYYLLLEEIIQNAQNLEEGHTPRMEALNDVLQRVERVGAPNEE